ncbi:uncharacterized protein LOC111697289 isoform X2 [Eurytemora carolleeae]|uniref:uncharacterized protein LOC111697289 isoform X2 n=1 Tax=Eurytemora carolleeae TaxID=1294199 RepID=UPI000C777E30|nr:uncharacterized protein LOC111697289 isoform X2 [Eurytemora carolleeae]|eukprot:XP_023322998.1 uncharacterized protein LOC111697289 isoform X2 [Eurytemora affinis]
MSGVASKLSRLPRSRSSGSSFLKIELQYGSLRRLHGSILNPRAPKIRHLNSSHSLLIELDKHIAKVQELEYKVYEMEAQLQMREALKSQEKLMKPLPPLEDTRLKKCLVSEEERNAFQNRLIEAKKKAELLSLKRNQQETNILSWHSKKLKNVLDEMNKTDSMENSLKLLAAPTQNDEENNIFSCLNALVEIVNLEPELDLDNPGDRIDQLKNLFLEKETLKQQVENLKYKIGKSSETKSECEVSLFNIETSIATLQLEVQSSRSYLGTLLRQKQNTALWIYGPNPIFSGIKDFEFGASFENQFVVELLKKMEISRLHARNNLAYAQNLVNKYKTRLAKISKEMSVADAKIDAQVVTINKSDENIVDKPKNVVKIETPALPAQPESIVCQTK